MGRKAENLEDMIFGKLVVVDKGPRKNGSITWNCLCECGEMVNVRVDYLKCGRKTHCGCSPKPRGPDLTGQRFGRLVALHKAEPARDLTGTKNRSVWTCLCDCGKVVDIRATGLTSGRSQSCGCLLEDYRKSQRRK